MTLEHHDLRHEFPEFTDKIHHLKVESAHFAKLFDEYHQIDREILRIEQQVETPSDAYTEDLKRKRVKLKDELYALLSD